MNWVKKLSYDPWGRIISKTAYDLSGHPLAFTQDLGQRQKTFFLHANARGDVVAITDDAMNWPRSSPTTPEER